MPLLAMIQDPRGREPLEAMLLDRNPRMRQVAAGCLAHFPSTGSRVALERLLQQEKREDVRVRATHSLVELYDAGQDGAVRRLLDLLMDPREPTRVREAAFALVASLPQVQRRGILARLAEDDDARIRNKAEAFDHLRDVRGELPAAELQQLQIDLASNQYEVWNEAVRRLSASGAGIIEPLLARMERNGRDPEYCTRAGMALKALGPRRGRSLVEALDRIDAPLPLQVIVEVIGGWGMKSLIYRFKDLLDRVGATSEPGASGYDLMQRVRAKAHLELARIGSRVAIQDLRDALSGPDRRLELETVTAMRWIGKKEELPLLLEAFAAEDGFMRQQVGEAVREIMKRERIRRNNRWFHTLSPELRESLRRILPAASRKSKKAPRRLSAS